jgi:hypothetical protein
MVIRDLPKILRVIAHGGDAHVVVVHGDDAVSFNAGDLGPEAAWMLRRILYQAYLKRGGYAVKARLTRRGGRWNIPIGLLTFGRACRNGARRLLSPLWVWLRAWALALPLLPSRR